MNYTTGNIFESEAEVLVNTVNTQGVMGKGIALQFKKLFPNNYNIYKKRCENKDFDIGDLIITKEVNVILGEKTIVNFPTKRSWRKPSEYTFIEVGLERLVEFIKKNKIKSIAIPPLGTGNGGLVWSKVKVLMEKFFAQLEGCEVTVYEPNQKIKELLNKEKVKLTPARAMLLYMLIELVKN